MSSKPAHKLLLASASSRRLDLLRQINIIPTNVIPAKIDEAPQKNETPRDLAKRLSQEKAEAIYSDNKSSFILAADTVVACGKNILDKAKNFTEAEINLQKLSGRRHRVYGSLSLITPDGRKITSESVTIVQFKQLSNHEIKAYLDSKEWEDKAGSYAIQGLAGAFIKFLSGSYSNVVGLSLYDTIKILESGGYNQPVSKPGKER